MNMSIKFFKLGNEWLNNELSDIQIIESLDMAFERFRAEYSKLLFYAWKKDLYEDVETPIEEVSFEEFQTEEGQHKEWNRYVTDLNLKYINGNLLEHAIEVWFGSDKYLLLFEINGKEVYAKSTYLGNITNDCADVTTEFIDRLKKEINVDEIEEYVKTHTEDEIEKKYSAKGYEEYFWDW